MGAAPLGVKSRVEQILARSDNGRCALSSVAKSLGLSQRTLARRLADAGVTYRDLVDTELKARAGRWLEAGVLSRGEIGERLGFADATGFSRACRRWFRSSS
jgi:AraC-like DNA-binding protein